MITMAEAYNQQEDLNEKIEIVQHLLTHYVGKLKDPQVSKEGKQVIQSMLKEFLAGLEK
jgi:hypothetical protein